MTMPGDNDDWGYREDKPHKVPKKKAHMTTDDEIGALIQRIANTHIWRDTYPDGPDLMSGHYEITPDDVRCCRAAAQEPQMTTDDEWVRARAERVTVGLLGEHSDGYTQLIAAALHEAISRAHTTKEQAVAAERDEALRWWRNESSVVDELQKRLDIAEAKLVRLNNPDDALVEAVGVYLVNWPTETGVAWNRLHSEIRQGYVDEARGVIRALSEALNRPSPPSSRRE